MKFLLDENFPKSAITFLEQLGHECHDIRGSSLEGCSDAEVVREALRLEAVILTTDRDFYHSLPVEFPDHYGFVVVALRQPSRTAIMDRLEWLLSEVDESDFAARAFQLRDLTWIARPPIPEDP